MTQKRTLKEIALDLLCKYDESETCRIWLAYGIDRMDAENQLHDEIYRYKAEIESASMP